MKSLGKWFKELSISNKILVIIVAIGLIALAVFGYNKRQEQGKKQLNANLQRVKEQEANDVIEIENSIKEIREQNTKDKKSDKRKVNSEIFSTTIFFGDSYARQMEVCDYVSEYNIISKDMLRPEDADDLLDKVVALNPEHVVIMIGQDSVTKTSRARLLQGYRRLVENLKDRIPSARIHIISFAKVSGVTGLDLTPYNQTLQDMAKEFNCTYIDNSDTNIILDKEGNAESAFFKSVESKLIKEIGGNDGTD